MSPVMVPVRGYYERESRCSATVFGPVTIPWFDDNHTFKMPL